MNSYPMICSWRWRGLLFRGEASIISKVSVIRTSPDSVLADYGKFMDLAGIEEAISKDVGAVIKLNHWLSAQLMGII